MTEYNWLSIDGETVEGWPPTAETGSFIFSAMQSTLGGRRSCRGRLHSLGEICSVDLEVDVTLVAGRGGCFVPHLQCAIVLRKNFRVIATAAPIK